MRLFLASIALATSGLVTPVAAAQAQTAGTGIAAGTQIVDTSGGAVGVVTRVDGSNLIIRTDRHEVQLPSDRFTPHEGKLLFGMTQAELNAATDASLAEAASAITVGATVRGAGGNSVGTIDSLDEEFATIKLSSGSLVRIPRSGVAADSAGPVIGLTLEELEAQGGSSADASQ